MQCQFNSVAMLDPECHGYHPTCWIPWSATCPACPPPVSGVYPILNENLSPEMVPPPQPLLSPPNHKSPPPETEPAPSEPIPSPEGPAAPSQPTPAPSETTPAETTPPPGEPTPATQPSAPETQPTVPDLPPLVPPGREIPGGPQPKEKKRTDDKLKPTTALIEDVLLESSGCPQATPLGTITAATEPAKLETPPAQVEPQEISAPHESVAPVATDQIETPSAPAGDSADQPGVVQAIYQAIVPAESTEKTDAANEEALATDEPSESEASASSDSPAAHGPLFNRLGGILIVACSLACGALYLKSLMSANDEDGAGA